MQDRATKRLWEGVGWIGIGVACSLVGCSWLGGSKSQNEQSLQAETPSGASATQEGNAEEIIFAGLSGNPPRFIDSGPLRGMGWQEEETREIRKGLRDAGFKLKMEYMTPARIEHEFQSHHPICTYPVEWKDPEKTFSQTPDRIYSIALQLGGEVTRSIIINRSDAAKFSKHRKSNGNIDIDSLLADSSLKTLMIRDKDYGRLSRKVLEVTEVGEQGVRPEYQRSINLLVIRDNRQIIEMLNASRFDYYFSDGVEDLDLKASGLDWSKFQEISYDTGAVRDIHDPALVRVSVACAIHPSTIQAMPYINQWIQLQRGQGWLERKQQYRRKFDERFFLSAPPTSISSTTRFSQELRFGIEEKWYPKQERHFPNLSLFPRPKPSSPPLVTQVVTRQLTQQPLRWVQILLAPDRVAVLSEADAQWFHGQLQVANFFDRDGGWRAMGPLRFYDGLPLLPQELGRAIEKQSYPKGLLKSELKSLKVPPNTRELTLFGSGLMPEDVPGLLSQLPSLPLTAFTLWDGGVDTSKAVVAGLPLSVIHLQLLRSSLIDSNLPEKISKMLLTQLSLQASQLGESQTQELFKNLPSSLESLSLAYGSFYGLRALALWAQKPFPRLRALELTQMNLGDEHVPLLSKVFSQSGFEKSPKGIEILNLAANHLSAKGVQELLSTPFESLRELDLSGSQLMNAQNPRLKIPLGVEKLSLCATGLSQKSFGSLSLPKRLSRAEFGGNAIGDVGFEALVDRLMPRVETLDLSGTGITGKSILLLSQAKHVLDIGDLNLSSNQLRDLAIAPIQNAKFSIKRLDLASNLVSNQGLPSLFPFLEGKLEALNLSATLLNEQGTQTLARKLPPTLKGLAMDNVLGVDIPALAGALPSGLGLLALSNNQISDTELALLAPKLPPGLWSLGLAGSSFTDRGIASLVKALPRVASLAISGAMTGKGFEQLMLELPSSLKLLAIRIGRRVSIHVDLAQQFPALSGLNLTVNSDAPSTQHLVESLPNSILGLYFSSSDLNPNHFAALIENAPRNLRFLQVNGRTTDNFAALRFSKLPRTVVDLRMGFSMIPLNDWIALGSLRLDQLRSFQFSGEFGQCRWPKTALDAIERATRGLRQIYADNCSIESGSLDLLGPHVLESLRFLSFQKAGLTGRQLKGLLPRLRSDMATLSLKANSLTDADIPSFIENLPKDLQTLVLSGNKLGQNGLDLLHAYRTKREKEGDGVFTLVE